MKDTKRDSDGFVPRLHTVCWLVAWKLGCVELG